MLDFEMIKQALPQRFPYFMVDRIIELKEKERVVGIKNITGNEIAFLGHFPERAFVAGTMTVEIMVQVATFLFYRKKQKSQKLNFYLGVIKEARFLKVVCPGDQLRVEARPVRITSNNAYVEAKAFVEDNLVAQGEFVFVRRK